MPCQSQSFPQPAYPYQKKRPNVAILRIYRQNRWISGGYPRKTSKPAHTRRQSRVL